MNSPQTVLSPPPAGKLLILRLKPRTAAAPLAAPLAPPFAAPVAVPALAANEGVLAKLHPTATLSIAAPAIAESSMVAPSIAAPSIAGLPTSAQQTAQLASPTLPRVPLLIALAAGFWALGTLILLTLAMAARLLT